tara:strand:+ start:2037 stop:2315 length:279 start_codon:yes stop_codon:yes gene_type:complete
MALQLTVKKHTFFFDVIGMSRFRRRIDTVWFEVLLLSSGEVGASELAVASTVWLDGMHAMIEEAAQETSAKKRYRKTAVTSSRQTSKPAERC